MKTFSQSILTAIAFFAMINNTVAQDVTDVMRYSFINPSGTARSMGFGNALGSVGGDFSTLSINPAGIGIYRRSEMMITPSIHINNVKGDYLNETNAEASSRVNFNNLGMVFTHTPRGRRYDRSEWKAVSFGLGFNRLADFNRTYSYGGLNTQTSYSQVFLNEVLQDPTNYQNNLGYQSYLINQDNLGFYALPYEATTQLRQKRYVEEHGGMNELLLSLGGNYMEKLMLGATVGIPIINYKRNNYFEETDATDNPDNYFKAFRYSETLQTTGIGFDLKLGAIYKPSDYFRLGVALHTPTWIALTDNYTQSITSNTETFKQTLGGTDTNPITTVDAIPSNFNYSIRTPWKAVLSATGMLGTHGFITADYEYVDYQSARLSFDNLYAAEENTRNAEIKSLTQATSNFRIGIEGKLENFFIRAGFGYYGSPYKSSISNVNRINISGGIGYRNNNFFADLGFMHTDLKEYETPYTLSGLFTPTATLQSSLNNLAITVGFKL